jgi:predicted dienelactone hydrolase
MNPELLRTTSLGLLFAALQPLASRGQGRMEKVYDPLSVPRDIRIQHLDLNMRDDARSRDIPLRIYLPAQQGARPVVLFSHGLGGTRLGCAYMGEHWAARGYVAVFLQHPGSDDSVWKNAAFGQWMAAMQQAASLRNFELRVVDVRSVLSQLEAWNKDAHHPLSGRLDMKHVGMSGHSFGAVTTQAVSGEAFRLVGTRLTDPRIKAAIAFSPSGARGGESAANPFGSVKIPWMLMTGTRDTAPIGGMDVASRLGVFPALPPGDKYEVVLYNAEHSAFVDGPLPGDQEARNPNHHRVILALSTAFWDAYLRDDTAALAWLKGAGPHQILEEKDVWKTK